MLYLTRDTRYGVLVTRKSAQAIFALPGLYFGLEQISFIFIEDSLDPGVSRRRRNCSDSAVVIIMLTWCLRLANCTRLGAPRWRSTWCTETVERTGCSENGVYQTRIGAWYFRSKFTLKRIYQSWKSFLRKS